MMRSMILLTIVILGLVGPARAQTLRVLVTNDDGVMANGIDALVEELSLNPNLDLTVIAPAANASGSSDSFNGSITVAASTTASGFPATAVTGLPADCVMYGILEAMAADPPDIVISGINDGQNITRYIAEDGSGTVGAALTAGRLGVPAIAVSAAIFGPDFTEAATYTANVVENFRVSPRLSKKMQTKTGLGDRVVLNVNFPNCSGGGSVRGVEVVPLAHSQTILGANITSYTDQGGGVFDAVLTAAGPIFVTDCTSTVEDPTDDLAALSNGFATVTALNPTLTLDGKLKRFKFLRKIPFN